MIKKVTVIVPMYRKFDKLENNLNSIISQTYSNIEVIVTDDGSENYNEQLVKGIIQKLKKKRKNIEIILIHHPSNLGSVKNFNEAVKISTGDYIFPLAQDDEFYDEKVIENIVENFKGNICTTFRECISEEKRIIGVFPEKKRIKKLLAKENYLDLLLNGNYISGASTYYKREIFKKYGFFDENMKLLEDYPYFLMLLRNREKINFIPIKTIKYNYGGVSTSKNVNLMLLNDFRVTLKREKEILTKYKYIKRILTYRIESYEYKINKKNKIDLYLKYLDIVFINILKKFFNINLYNFLIKRELKYE